MTDSDEEYRAKRKKKKHHHKHRHREAREGAVCTPELKMKMMDLIQSIMRKDVHMIFAEPVTDQIAPGYSTYITNPMDLSTMQVKVQRGEYTSLKQLKGDADMMCRNCMVYNSPDTIFYREALKIQSYINQLFGERRGVMKETMKEIDDAIKKKNRIQEELIGIEVEEQVKKAAKAARHKLNTLKPDTRVGFLSEEDGYTLMNILNAPKGEPTEKVVDMSCLKKHENTVTSLLNAMKEKKREQGKPVQYLNYGPYGSFAPQYDSVFSQLDQQEQQLLYRSYGDDLGLTYCRSVQEFARGASDSLRDPVETIINCLTGGGHAKASKLLANTYMKVIKERKAQKVKRTEKNLTQQSFLNFLESDEMPPISTRDLEDPVLQDQADNTSALTSSLHQEDTDILNTASQSDNNETSCPDKEASTTQEVEQPLNSSLPTSEEESRTILFPPFMD